MSEQDGSPSELPGGDQPPGRDADRADDRIGPCRRHRTDRTVAGWTDVRRSVPAARTTWDGYGRRTVRGDRHRDRPFGGRQDRPSRSLRRRRVHRPVHGDDGIGHRRSPPEPDRGDRHRHLDLERANGALRRVREPHRRQPARPPRPGAPAQSVAGGDDRPRRVSRARRRPSHRVRPRRHPAGQPGVR